MYRAVPSKYAQICHQNDSKQNIVQKCAGYIIKILAECDVKYRLCISDHDVEFPQMVHCTATPLPFRLHTSPHTLLYNIIYLLFEDNVGGGCHSGSLCYEI